MAYDETDTAEELTPEGEGGGGYGGAEFVPEAVTPRSAKADVYTLILVLTFVFFLVGVVLTMRELWLHYDVEFWVFKRK